MLILLAGHQKVFSKTIYLSGIKYDVQMSKMTFVVKYFMVVYV